MDIITREIDGLLVGQRDNDGYVNATAMCRAAAKRIQDYWDNAGTKAFLDEVSAITGISVIDLIESRKGGRRTNQGTWVHPQVAIHLGQWCSPKFAALVSKWVMDWMMLSVQGQPVNQPIQLTEHQQARQEGKFVRRKYTDAIQDYMLRHTELSEDSRRWMYVNASDAINKVVFRKTARELCLERGVSDRNHLRDSMSTEELLRLGEVESLTMRLIDQNDMHPCPAAREAGERLMLSQCKRVRGVEKKSHKVLTPVLRYR